MTKAATAMPGRNDAAAPLKPEPGGRGLAERAYQALRRAIQDGDIQPGQRVLEGEIGAWLKVSRTPVREALRRLQAQGLLETAPGGGLAVAHYDLRAVAELYDLREQLEGAAAALASRHADATEIHMLQALVHAQRDLADDARVHMRENKLFHEQIHRAAHNRFLWSALQSLHDSIALLGRTTFRVPGRIGAAVVEHHDIVAAIAAREPERAEELMRAHIRNGYQARIAAMTEDVKQGRTRDPAPA